MSLILCIAVSGATFAANAGFNVSYDGGSLPDVKTGEALRLVATSTAIELVHGKTLVV
jgi:hypothetical protein